MKNKKFCDNIIIMCMAMLYAVMFVGSGSRFASIVIIIIALIIFLIELYENSFTLPIRFEIFHIYLMAFSAFCLSTCFWALSSTEVIRYSKLVIVSAIAVTVLSVAFAKLKSVDLLLKGIMFGGYVAVLYVFVFYGYDYVANILQSGSRIQTDEIGFERNILGICSAVSILINAYYILYDKLRYWSVLMIPACSMIIACGTKKAIVIALAGIVLLILFKYGSGKKIVNSVVKTIIVLVLFFLLVSIFSKMPVFSGVMERIESMITAVFGIGNSFTTSTKSDYIRMQLIAFGLEQFQNKPILGFGINNSHLLVKNHFNYDFYLHTNYIELLVDGGVIGFAFYYSIYVYAAYWLLKLRDFASTEYIMCVILFVLFLIMDIGMVSYELGITYVRLLLYVVEIRILKKKQKRKMLINF